MFLFSNSLLFLFLGCIIPIHFYMQCTLRFILKDGTDGPYKMTIHLKDLVVEAFRGTSVSYYNTYIVFNYSQPCACICPYVSLMWNLNYWSLYQLCEYDSSKHVQYIKYVNQSQCFFTCMHVKNYYSLTFSLCEYYSLLTCYV